VPHAPFRDSSQITLKIGLIRAGRGLAGYGRPGYRSANPAWEHERVAYWLMKSEPFKYSWDDLVAEGEGTWDGVRNYLARNNLMAMEVGDEAFFYHSREGLEIVGIAEITVTGIGDPTDETGKWAAVKLKAKERLARPVTLAAIKAEPRLAEMQLIRLSRLSVCAVTPEEWSVILEMAKG
jgi:predicted RNA-binding protein with PUA-like domain